MSVSSVNGSLIALGGRKSLSILRLPLHGSTESGADLNPLVFRRQTKLEIHEMHWCPRGERQSWLATACGTYIFLWDVEASSPNNMLSRISAHQRNVSDVDFSPHDSNLLASSSADALVHVWDIREPRNSLRIGSFAAYTSAASRIHWNSLDSLVIASGHDSGELRIWDVRKPSAPLLLITAHTRKVTSLSWSDANPMFLQSSSLDGYVNLWSMDNSRTPVASVALGSAVQRARFTPFGLGFVASTRAPIHGPCLQLYSWHEAAAVAAASSSSLSAPSTETAKSSTVMPVHQFIGHNDSILSLDWRVAPQVRGSQLVSWSKDHQLRLWAISADIYQALGRDDMLGAISGSVDYEERVIENAADFMSPEAAEEEGDTVSATAAADFAVPMPRRQRQSFVPQGQAALSSMQGVVDESSGALGLVAAAAEESRSAGPVSGGERRGGPIRFAPFVSISASSASSSTSAGGADSRLAGLASGQLPLTASRSLASGEKWSLKHEMDEFSSAADGVVLDRPDAVRRSCVLVASALPRAKARRSRERRRAQHKSLREAASILLAPPETAASAEPRASGLIRARVQLSFPVGYPHQPPQVYLLMSSRVPQAKRAHICMEIEGLARTLANASRPSLLACAQRLSQLVASVAIEQLTFAVSATVTDDNDGDLDSLSDGSASAEEKSDHVEDDRTAGNADSEEQVAKRVRIDLPPQVVRSDESLNSDAEYNASTDNDAIDEEEPGDQSAVVDDLGRVPRKGFSATSHALVARLSRRPDSLTTGFGKSSPASRSPTSVDSTNGQARGADATRVPCPALAGAQFAPDGRLFFFSAFDAPLTRHCRTLADFRKRRKTGAHLKTIRAPSVFGLEAHSLHETSAATSSSIDRRNALAMVNRPPKEKKIKHAPSNQGEPRRSSSEVLHFRRRQRKLRHLSDNFSSSQDEDSEGIAEHAIHQRQNDTDEAKSNRSDEGSHDAVSNDDDAIFNNGDFDAAFSSTSQHLVGWSKSHDAKGGHESVDDEDSFESPTEDEMESMDSVEGITVDSGANVQSQRRLVRRRRRMARTSAKSNVGASAGGAHSGASEASESSDESSRYASSDDDGDTRQRQRSSAMMPADLTRSFLSGRRNVTRRPDTDGRAFAGRSPSAVISTTDSSASPAFLVAESQKGLARACDTAFYIALPKSRLRRALVVSVPLAHVYHIETVFSRTMLLAHEICLQYAQDAANAGARGHARAWKLMASTLSPASRRAESNSRFTLENQEEGEGCESTRSRRGVDASVSDYDGVARTRRRRPLLQEQFIRAYCQSHQHHHHNYHHSFPLLFQERQRQQNRSTELQRHRAAMSVSASSPREEPTACVTLDPMHANDLSLGETAALSPLATLPWAEHPLGGGLARSLLEFALACDNNQLVSVLSAVLRLADSEIVGKGDDVMNARILTPALDAECDASRLVYADLLHRLGELERRAEVINSLTTQSRVILDRMHEEQRRRAMLGNELILEVRCHRCAQEQRREDALALLPNGRTAGRESCNECGNVRLVYCTVCRIPVRGLLTLCRVCGHGGHATHVNKWFAENDGVCAQPGCFCKCKSMMDTN